MLKIRGHAMRGVRSRFARGGACAGLALLSCLAAGCQKTETRFEVLSFRREGMTERFTEHFPDGAFSRDAHRNLDIVFEIAPSLVELPPEGAAKESDGLWMGQLVHVNVFWQPRPGTTYAEATQTNASIVYCLLADEHVITYEGAGFVYYTISRDGKTIEGRIESSSLVPVRFVNSPADLFGPCRLEGTFVAREDRRAVVDASRRLRRRAGPESSGVADLGSTSN